MMNSASRTGKRHEPLFHITRRTEIGALHRCLIRAAAIILGMLLSALVVVILTDYNPFEIYKAIFEGTFGSSRKLWVTLQGTAVLLCISIAVTPAFRMRFWNTGAEGQVLVSALAAAACMVYAGDRLPSAVLLALMFAASILAGIVWAVIPAICKALWNTNETLFTLMMNYVAAQLVSFCIMVWVPNGSRVLGVLNLSSKNGWFPEIAGQKYLLNILIVLVLTALIYIYLQYSKHGYEISVVGESENTARYIGINVKKVIIRTMVLSGALCGVAGMILVAGASHTVTSDLVGGDGFTAIMVSWLAKFNPIFMLLTSFLLVFLRRGASQMATTCNLNESVADIMTGIIIFFIIGCEFFIRYRVNFRHRAKPEAVTESEQPEETEKIEKTNEKGVDAQ